MTEFDIPAGTRAIEVEEKVLPVLNAAKSVVNATKFNTGIVLNSPAHQAINELAAALDALFEQGIKGPANL